MLARVLSVIRGGSLSRALRYEALALLGLFLGVFAPLSQGQEAAQAYFPFGLYDKAEIAPGSAEWDAYYVRLFAVLSENDLNTLLIQPYRNVQQTLSVMNRAQASRIKVIMSVGNPLNPAWDFMEPGRPFFRAYTHPSVVAYKYGDEPAEAADLNTLRKAYAAIRRHSRLPILTAMVGENMDFTTTDIALRAWADLRSEVRFVRHYPARRTYGIDDLYKDKMQLTFAEWAHRMENDSDTPWWFIPQTFGKGMQKNDAAYWRFPTAREVNAMTHVALANGARGIIGYALQDHGQFLGLIDGQFAPRKAYDGSVPLHAFRSLGRLIREHAAFLARHKRAEFSVSVNNSYALAIPRFDPADQREYVYLVNKDTEYRQSGTLAVQRVSQKPLRMQNVYLGSPNSVAVTNGSIAWTLAPGEAQLLLLLDR
jgi:hypothetical protein